MRVLHINRNYLGTTLHQTMVEHLDKLGVENSVFVPICKTESATIKPNNNVCVSCCFKNIDRYVFDLKQLKIIRAIEKNFDISSFDCLHAYTLFTDGNAAMKLAEKYKKPFVVAVRNTDVNDFFAKLFYLRGRGIKIMRKAKKIFFLSEAYRKQVFEKYVPQKYYDELYAKTLIIPNGIDDFWFANLPSEEKKTLNNPIKLIYAGRIDKNKNLPTIQKAMDVLESKGIKSTLTVVGKIIDESEFNKIKNDERISYIPAMPKEQLIDQYRSHDVFVMPSFTETFGLVYAEALSQGLPVVYSKGQGFDGQFEEGCVGYHCDANDAKNVGKNIERVVLEYFRIKSNCLKASLKFNWVEICENYIKVYKKVK
ncbi:MAG: glycosyltransferase family 4 protein [Fibrobacter sp.]|nr:glycosyltransferase family 4 protein [Fibrobacter sp.]